MKIVMKYFIGAVADDDNERNLISLINLIETSRREGYTELLKKDSINLERILQLQESEYLT